MSNAITKYGAALDAVQKKALEAALKETPDNIQQRLSEHLGAITKAKAIKLLECLIKRYQSSFWVHDYPRDRFDERMQITLIDYFPQIKGMVFECFAPKIKDVLGSGEYHIIAYSLNSTRFGMYVDSKSYHHAWDDNLERERTNEECIAIWNRFSLMDWRESNRYDIKMSGLDKRLLNKIKVGDVLGAITVGNSRTPLNSGSPDEFFQVVKIKNPNIYFKSIEHRTSDKANIQPILNKFTDVNAPGAKRWLKIGTFRHPINFEKKFVRIKLDGERRFAYLMTLDHAGEYQVFYENAY